MTYTKMQRFDTEQLAISIIELENLPINFNDVQQWTDFDLDQWIQAWGYRWNGEYYILDAQE